MDPKEKERIAVCRILLDIAESIEGGVSVSDCPHFKQLKNKLTLTEQHFEIARKESVLVSLITLRSAHYNTKMLLAMTVCDLYSEYMLVPLDYCMAFDTLMNAIEWPISFSDLLARTKSE